MSTVSQDDLQAMIAKFQAGEVIADRLPFTFPSGTQLTRVSPQCKICRDAIPNQDFRESWNQVLPDVVMIDGHGVCRECKCITAFIFRVRAQPGLVLESIDAQGRWVQRTSTPSVWGQIKRQLKLLFAHP
ncbi:TPA: hypothetical protein ACP32N_005010 [Pseudomonas aeruginosa]